MAVNVFSDQAVEEIRRTVNRVKRSGPQIDRFRAKHTGKYLDRGRPVKIVSNTGSATMTAANFLAVADGTYTVKIEEGDGSTVVGQEIVECNWVYGRLNYFNARNFYLILEQIWGTLLTATADGWVKDSDDFQNGLDTYLNLLDAFLTNQDTYNAAIENFFNALVSWGATVVEFADDQIIWNAWAADTLGDIFGWMDDARTWMASARTAINSILSCAASSATYSLFQACLATISAVPSPPAVPTVESEPTVDDASPVPTSVPEHPAAPPSYDLTPPTLASYSDVYSAAGVNDRAWLSYSHIGTKLLCIDKRGNA